MPLELIGIAIVFPIVFSIGRAFQRRESALVELADFQANLIGHYFAHRDWPDSPRHEQAKRPKSLSGSLCAAVRAELRAPGESNRERVYDAFSDLSKSLETLRREAGLASSDLAHANQYLKLAIANFEEMRNIAIYRTPRSFRSFTKIFLMTFAILFGPYLAYVSESSVPVVGYLVAIVYSLVPVGLDGIQEDLENPYDGIGSDDIDFGEGFEL